MHIGRNDSRHTYYVAANKSNMLSMIESERGVGVGFDRNLKFDFHTNDCINKSKRIIKITSRSLTHKFNALTLTSLLT